MPIPHSQYQTSLHTYERQTGGNIEKWKPPDYCLLTTDVSCGYETKHKRLLANGNNYDCVVSFHDERTNVYITFLYYLAREPSLCLVCLLIYNLIFGLDWAVMWKNPYPNKSPQEFPLPASKLMHLALDITEPATCWMLPFKYPHILNVAILYIPSPFWSWTKVACDHVNRNFRLLASQKKRTQKVRLKVGK